MNRDSVKKALGYRLHLQPAAVRLDQDGIELPPRDDEWLVERVDENGVAVKNLRTDHGTTLGFDHIHHFTTDPDKSQGQLQYGFFSLHVQLYLQGDVLYVRPTLRPGERLPPPAVSTTEKIVDLRFPADTGLSDALASNGYKVAWCSEAKLARRLELEGWERVIVRDTNGHRTSFRLKDSPHDQILLKKKLS